LKINLFSSWYSWTIAELELNNNHSLTHSLYIFRVQSQDTATTNKLVNVDYLAFQPFDFERTWWRLFQKRVVSITFYIYVFITITGSIHLLVDY